jgi:Na+-translocating ferredoxin:NAD+ oxidoreductase subunit B
MPDAATLNALLPQTQCTSCGYPDCAHYAQALAAGQAEINQCPPGGVQGIARLAQATGRPVIPLNPVHGVEGPRYLAVIDEAWCIGCTLCIKACPVDCIVGASKQMHTVIEAECTGCELCIPACPVDCISLVPVHEAEPRPTGWAAWGQSEADAARLRYEQMQERRQRAQAEHEAQLRAKAEYKLAHLAELTKVSDESELARKRAVVEAALARARARRQPG